MSAEGRLVLERETAKERERDKDRERDRDRESDRERERKGRHQSQLSLQQQQQQYSQSVPPFLVAPAPPPQLNQHIVVSLLSFIFVLGNFIEVYFIGEQENLYPFGHDRKRRFITRLPCT